MNGSIAGKLIESIRVNSISREVRKGRALLVKRRRAGAALVAKCANAFFRVAHYPVFVWTDVRQWQHWEIGSFNLLHGSEFESFSEGRASVCADILPGTSLAEHFETGTFKPEMLDAAAVELRRAHGLNTVLFGGPWSHGDANLANFLYSAGQKRARLIDFELVHRPGLPAVERHAEDLLAFLQDLLGCCSDAEWLGFALRFIEGYGLGETVDVLREKLQIQTGLARIWWWIRVNYVPLRLVRVRLQMLRQALS